MGKKTIATMGMTAFLGATAAIGLPITAKNEGMKLVPYYDSAHILSWCAGETQIGYKDHFTIDECYALFAKSYGYYSLAIAMMYNDKAKEVVTLPIHAAQVDTGYNIGLGGYLASSMLRQLNLGNAKGGCDAILLYKRSAGRDCSLPMNQHICGGIWSRRLQMKDLCYTGLSN